MKKGSKYKPGQNKGGRPPIEITDDMIKTTMEKARYGSKKEFIASHLGISLPVFEKRLLEFYQKGRFEYLDDLTKLQTRSARGYWEEKIFTEKKKVDGEIVEVPKTERRYVPPSFVMQIWLGKQDLDQREKIEQDINQTNTEFRIEVMDESVKKFIEKGNFFSEKLPESEVLQVTDGEPNNEGK